WAGSREAGRFRRDVFWSGGFGTGRWRPANLLDRARVASHTSPLFAAERPYATTGDTIFAFGRNRTFQSLLAICAFQGAKPPAADQDLHTVRPFRATVWQGHDR